MHILLVSHYWEPEQGVVQRRWNWLSQALVDAGHTLTVIAPPPHYPGGKLLTDEQRCAAGAVDRSRPGVVVYRTKFSEHDQSIVSRVKGQGTVMLSQISTASKAIKEAKTAGNPIDAVCCTVPALPSAMVAYTIAKRHALPFVIELRDAWPEILTYMDAWYDDRGEASSMLNKTKLEGFHFLMKSGGEALSFLLTEADAIITTTKSLARLEKHKGCRNVITVRNRANAGIVNCNVYPKREDGPLNVLYAGTIGRAQGLENAINALAFARDHGADVVMRIAGGGAHLKPVKKEAKRLGVPVEFLGRIPFDEITDQYKWADTVLVHLQDWEPMEYTIPSKLFEAMWAEKHVSAALAGEAAKIVEKSAIGDVVTPMDPAALGQLWIDLFNNRDRLEVDGNGAKWFAGNLTLEELASQWMEALQAAVDEHESRDHALIPRAKRTAGNLWNHFGISPA